MYDLSIKADWEYHPNTRHKLNIGGNYTTHNFETKTHQALAYQNYLEETSDTMVVRGKSTRNSHEVMMFAEDEFNSLTGFTPDKFKGGFKGFINQMCKMILNLLSFLNIKDIDDNAAKPI